MAHRWGMVVILWSVSAMWLVVVGPAWALPTHDYKHDYGTREHEYGDTDDHGKSSKSGKLSGPDEKDYHLDKGWWKNLEKHKEYDEHDFKRWGKGPVQYDPDCDPPVASPEPATLLLLGSTLAGVGVYSRRRRQPAGGTDPIDPLHRE